MTALANVIGFKAWLPGVPFGEWTKVFPDPRLAKDVVDRPTHRVHIIETGTTVGHCK